MRHLLIDTDTASDDAVALIMALREPSVRVEAITVVAGNVPVDQGTRNARIAVAIAYTYRPPVYRGQAAPLMRPLRTSEQVHGSDGLGDLDMEDPDQPVADGHAVDVIIEMARRFPGELEIVTLGPLTNLALACLREPNLASMVKQVTLMGGTGVGPGNMTPVAEFNIYVDAEAAHIVLNSGLPLLFVGWDVSTGATFMTDDDLDLLLDTGSPVAIFCVQCNNVLRDYNEQVMKRNGIDLPDPVAMMAALYPDVITRQVQRYTYVDYKSESGYGQLVIDHHHLLGRPANATTCLEIDAARFKETLLQLIGSE